MNMNRSRVITWILALAGTIAASGCVVVVPSHHMRSPWSHHHGGR
jgi:hypothetical protein